MAGLLAALALTASWISWISGADVMSFIAHRGFALESPSQWLFGHPLSSFVTNICVLIATAATMAWINNQYNILRSFSVTFIGLFLLMNAATPAVSTRFAGGTLLALIVMVAMLMMYSVYNSPRRGAKRIFLVFLLLAAGALTQYGFMVYIPVFIMGIGQMRAVKFRTLTAAALGIVTPLWLWWALWPDGFPTPQVPELDNPFATLELSDRIHFFATIGVTLFTGLILGAFNLMKIYSYNAKSRALNGLVTVIGVITCVSALVYWTNMPFYVPLLNVCVAFQAGHFFHISIKYRWGYLTMLLLCVIYTGLWIWCMI